MSTLEVQVRVDSNSEQENMPQNPEVSPDVEDEMDHELAQEPMEADNPDEEQIDELSLGQRGERAAQSFLRHRGYDILETNWVCPAGEADIIARDNGVIVFVEVKTRSSLEKGFPAEAVTSKKRARYEKIAAYYLSSCEDVNCQVRFDVISILVLQPNRAYIRHHVNAFSQGD